MNWHLFFSLSDDVDVRSILDQKTNHVSIINRGSDVKWRATKLILLVDVSTWKNKQTNDSYIQKYVFGTIRCYWDGMEGDKKNTIVVTVKLYIRELISFTFEDNGNLGRVEIFAGICTTFLRFVFSFLSQKNHHTLYITFRFPSLPYSVIFVLLALFLFDV